MRRRGSDTAPIYEFWPGSYGFVATIRLKPRCLPRSALSMAAEFAAASLRHPSRCGSDNSELPHRIRFSPNRLDVVTFLRHDGAVGAGDHLLNELRTVARPDGRGSRRRRTIAPPGGLPALTGPPVAADHPRLKGSWATNSGQYVVTDPGPGPPSARAVFRSGWPMETVIRRDSPPGPGADPASPDGYHSSVARSTASWRRRAWAR